MKFEQLTNEVLCWVKAAIVEAGCGEPTRAYPAAGAIAWDTCDQLTVSVAGRVYKSVSFPTEYRGDDRCFSGWLVVPLAIVWTRCVPTLDTRNNPPSPKALEEAFSAIYRDAAVVWNLVESGTLPDDEWERSIITQEFVGPQLGVLAIDTRVSIGVGHEVWC